MSPASGLLQTLSARGVRLALDSQDNLLIRGNRHALGDDLLASIRELKPMIVTILRAQTQEAPVDIGHAPRDEPLPVSYAQKRMWLLHQIDGGSARYNMFGAFHLIGALERHALERAFHTIVHRHESLRTCFSAGDDGEPVQRVQSAATFLVAYEDVTELPDAERPRFIGEQLARERSREFDLSADLMIRVRLLRIGDTEHSVAITLHHIASDGWSMSILLKELAALYGAYCAGRENPLSPLPIQYADYAHWQRTWLQGEVLQRSLAYWERQLADIPVLHNVPTDRPRPPIHSPCGSVYSASVNAQTRDALQTFCRERSATMFMGLHAAFAVLIARHSDETDIVIGTPIANREQAQVADLVGCFANTLVLRTDLSGSPDFNEVLRRSRAVLLDAYAHQQVPFEKIVERLQPQRSLGHMALFQIALVLQEQEGQQLQLRDLVLKRWDELQQGAKFDLALIVKPIATGMSLLWEYSTGLFERETIVRLAEHFGVLLRILLQRPDARVFQVEMISAAERTALLVKSNLSAMSYPVDKHLHQLFEAHARHAPDAIAAIYEAEQVTYAELNDRANRLAHYLRHRHGVKADHLVGLCLERSVEMVVAIIGVLKAGGAYVPLDPSYPAARLQYIVADAGLRSVLTTLRLSASVPLDPAQAVCMDAPEVQAMLAEESAHDLDAQMVGLQPSDLAYVIYTSGSTGLPKGVMVEHRQLTRLMMATRQQFAFDNRDVWTLFHSYSFDFSVWELWGALVHGGTLVVVPLAAARSPGEFCRLLARHRVTVLNQTPSAFTSLLQEEQLYSLQLQLRYVIFGGEALNPFALRRWVSARGDERPQLINMYGITETTVHVTNLRVTRETVECGGSVSPIGAPLPDMQLLILNAEQSLAPVGVPGEIYVGGAGVARGYLNRPDLDAARFVTLPQFSGGRFYRTGDRARHLPSGIEYLGRGDHQVKIRGFRIELGEIEAALASHSSVREVLVIADERMLGEKQLVAHYTVSDPVDTDELREFLRARLPEYMVPQHLILLSELPLTVNGKVDRKRLPAVRATHDPTRYVAPRTTLESLLCEAWQEALSVERVGVNENFFTIGGDSMRVVKLVRRAADRGVLVRVQDVFAHQTIAELAIFLATGNAERVREEAAPLHLLESIECRQYLDEHVEDCYPATAMQRLMWEMHQDTTLGAAVYLPQVMFEIIDIALRPESLKHALDHLMTKHPTLRTRFVRTPGGELLQTVRRRFEVQLPVLDLTTVDGPEQAQRIDDLLLGDARQSFELEQPCIRFRLLQLASRRWALMISTHHAIEDGWGFTQFTNELVTSYRRVEEGELLNAAVRPQNVFKEHVALEVEARQSTAHRAAWQALLSDYQPMPVVPSQSSTAIEGDAGSVRRRVVTIALSISEPRAEQLRQCARDRGVPLRAVFLLAYQRGLARLLRASVVTIDVVSSGRSARLTDPMRAMGLFWRFLPVVSGRNLDGSSALTALSAVLSTTDAHAAYPRDCIAGLVQVSADALTYAAFNFVDFHNRMVGDQSALVIRSRHSADRFHHALKFAIVKHGAQSLEAHLEYDRLSVSQADAARLVQLIEYELALLASDATMA